MEASTRNCQVSSIFSHRSFHRDLISLFWWKTWKLSINWGKWENEKLYMYGCAGDGELWCININRQTPTSEKIERRTTRRKEENIEKINQWNEEFWRNGRWKTFWKPRLCKVWEMKWKVGKGSCWKQFFSSSHYCFLLLLIPSKNHLSVARTSENIKKNWLFREMMRQVQK